MGLNNKHALQSGTIVLVTGVAGFIGFHASQALLERGCIVIGYDNCNEYYDVSLKNDRLKILSAYPDFTFIKGDLADKEALDDVFATYAPAIVLHLGAQAGVRYSIDNPYMYMQSNLVGFLNILEACRNFKIEHLVYASSSSVYGMNEKVPFSTSDNVDSPVSLYATTKKSNELMAHCYSHLYGFPSTGLRFFTVYGPWGRPDMAYFSFTNSIMKGEPIKIFNNGDMWRDFTYIDDVIEKVLNILPNPPIPNEHGDRYKVYNIGNNKPEQIMDYFLTLEKALGMTAKKEFLPMQPVDVYQTYADVDDLMRDFDFNPSTPIEVGLKKFVNWYRDYYEI